MMEMLKDWVRDLVIIVIFANLVEMLLPDSQLRKYLKVVIGFFIFLTILNPVLTLVDSDMDVFYPFDRYRIKSEVQSRSIQDQGENIKKRNQQLAVAAFERQLREQIRALILTQSEVEDTNLDLSVDNNGQIKALNIDLIFIKDKVNEENVKIKPIDEVEISIDSKERKDQESRSREEKRNTRGEKKDRK